MSGWRRFTSVTRALMASAQTYGPRMTLKSPLTSKTVLVGIAATAIATSFLAVAAAPANAAGLGSGRAVVHVDSTKATLAKQADGSYLLTMPKGTTGQWMGERKNAAGKTKVRVGNLTGEALVSNWSNLRYDSAGVDGTLAWNLKSKKPTAALVHVSTPTTTGSGVSFVLTSRDALPASVSNVALSLRRAPGAQPRSNDETTQNTNIVSDLWINLTNPDGTTATALIANTTNGNHCWTGTMNWSTPTLSIPTNTCDNIKYQNWSTTSKTPYGFTSVWNSNDTGSATLYLNLTPPGESMYEYTNTWNFS